MLKYLVIQLDNVSVSFCHYFTGMAPRLIDLNNLEQGILFAMKENLHIQFVYPDFPLPKEYKAAIESVDHTKIMSIKAHDVAQADIVVFNGIAEVRTAIWNKEQILVIRIEKSQLPEFLSLFEQIKTRVIRLTVIIIDVDRFSQADFDSYTILLDKLCDVFEKEYIAGNNMQLNLLSDRLILTGMNNCKAGDEVLALAPNGKFYVCPAFYCENADESCGDLVSGINIKNPQLYKLDHAPICRHCDAYQCRRCVWLNRKTTLEVNTPSREQCIVAHLERNGSRRILENLRKIGEFMPGVDIPRLDYLDPFEKHNEW